MQTHLSRRQLIKYSRTAFLAFSSSSIFGLIGNYQALGKSKNGGTREKVIADLQTKILEVMRKAAVPGAEIAVIKDGEILWSRGFGLKNRNRKDPVTDDTVFAAASLSKPVFAYAVLKMCEQGILNLDTPLTEYTDKPYIDDPRLKLITTRMVLSHTTGFPNWSGDDPVWIDFTPGTKFSYSSEGFLYLQKVVEKVTGQPLNEYMTRNIFVPFDMKNSSYVWKNQYESLAANGHDSSGNPQPLRKPSQAVSAGSLRTTATDFAKFLVAMMQPGAKDSFQLTEESLTQMVRPNIKINQSLAWGLGWGLENTPDGDFFWHWGDSGIFKSFTLGSRTLKVGIVILTNSENGLRTCREIVRSSIGGKHPAFDFSMINY